MDIFTIILIIVAVAIIGILIQMLLVRKKPKVKLKVKNEKVIEDSFDEEKLYRFTIFNDSDQSVVMEAIQLYSNDKEIFDNKHHPGFKAPEKRTGDVVEIDSKRVRDISNLLSENFLGTTVMQQHEEMTYSYYLDTPPDEIKITVRENENIGIMLNTDF